MAVPKAKWGEFQWTLDSSLSDRATAIQVAMALMHFARVQTWQELSDLLDAGGEPAARLRRAVMDHTPSRYLVLLDTFELTLMGLRRSEGNRSTFVTTIAECPVCGRWGYISGTAPKKCQWTRQCPGEPVKIVPGDYNLHPVQTPAEWLD